MKLVKGDKVRETDSKDLIEALKALGYEESGVKSSEVDEGDGLPETDVLDRDRLKAEADALELEYPKNIKTEKLYQLVYDKKAE